MNDRVTYRVRWYTPLFWRLLRKSGVFNWWLRDFLRDLFFDLEILDICREDILKKYHNRYDRTYRRVENRGNAAPKAT